MSNRDHRPEAEPWDRERARRRRLSSHLEDAGIPDPVLWLEQAACLQADPADFYADGDTVVGRAAQTRAVAVCAGCPVRRPCGATALARGERHGIWGGLTASERSGIPQARAAALLSQA